LVVLRAGTANRAKPNKMIDTLKLSKGLQRAGMTEAQAEGITEALKDAQTDYVTKKDLDLAIERLKGELQRFILVNVILATIAQVVAVKIWH
jgi:hypothetical protein